MPITVTDQYSVLMTITVLFTILSLIVDELNWKSVLLQWIVGVTWILSALGTFIIDTNNTTGLTNLLTYLFTGFGLIFSLAALYNSIQIMRLKGGP